MDSKGRRVDNMLVERVLNRLKYKKVFLNTYKSLRETRQGIGVYFQYNTRDVGIKG